MLVEEIMKRTVFTIRPNDTCENAAAFMASKNVGALIVTDQKDGVLGIVTERDMIRKLVAKNKSATTLVKEIMTQDIIVISPDFTLEEAADTMKQHRIKKLPVVKNDKMVGIVTATDLIAYEEKLVQVLAEAFLQAKGPANEDKEKLVKDLQTN